MSDSDSVKWMKAALDGSLFYNKDELAFLEKRFGKLGNEPLPSDETDEEFVARFKEWMEKDFSDE